MKRWAALLAALALTPAAARAGDMQIWRIETPDGQAITEVSTEPAVGDHYIAADNAEYEIVTVEAGRAVVQPCGMAELPGLDWMDARDTVAVMSSVRRIALYCTHTDESYEPTDGFYSSEGRGSICDVARALAAQLTDRGVETRVDETLHHPHDAGAYRRSRQTAVQLLRSFGPDCLLDIHRDGIPDPDSYAVTIGGQEASKIRLLVGRGNQNAEANRAFALMVKAVADRVYPGLIKDIYLGRGAFNQDLLPGSLLLECGTYTLEKERVLRSMPMMADVLDRALYGGVVGSAGNVRSDASSPAEQGGIVQGEPDYTPGGTQAVGSGLMFLGAIGVMGVAGLALLSAGTLKGGMRKAGRNLREMTGGLMGRKPESGEEHDHS